MIDSHRFCPSQHWHAQQGLNASQSAQAVSLDRRTVASWLAQAHFRPRKPRPHASTLDPFKPDIVRLLERSPSAAAQVCQRWRAHGVAGSDALGKAYVRTVRPRRQAAFLTLACAPGACAQVDGGAFGAVPVGHTHRQLRFCGMGLCDRRMLYVACTVSQTMEHFLACHQHAVDFFGGIPPTSMVDNLKSAVLKRAGGDAPVLTPPSLDVATPHGGTLAPCPVGTGNAKGRVENGVGYVQKHVLAGLDMPDVSALTPAARHGLNPVATVRLPGATREQPPVLWQTERPSWRPIPLHPCDLAPVSPVRASRPCRLTVEPNRSAVPAQDAGHALTLTTYPDRLCLSLGDQRSARHTRRDDRHTDVAAPEHPTPRLEPRKKARDHKVFRRFLALSPPAEASSLPLEERRLNPHHHVRKSVALSDIDTPEAVARAMEDAFVYEAFAAAYIANLVAQRARCTPEARARHLTRRGDLLDVRLAPPDLRSDYATPPPSSPPTEAGDPHG